MEISDIDVRKFVALCVDNYGQDEDDKVEGYSCLFKAANIMAYAAHETRADDTSSIAFFGRDVARAKLLIDHVMNGMPDGMQNQQRFEHVKERIASFVTAKEIRLGVIK